MRNKGSLEKKWRDDHLLRARGMTALIEACNAYEAARNGRMEAIRLAAACGVPKSDIAKIAGISRQTVYDWLGESGKENSRG